LHASDVGSPPPGVKPWGPVSAGQLNQAGFAHALLGHYHGARTGPYITYPGSPEPLGWQDAGRHCLALVTVTGSAVDVALEDFNQIHFVEETIDISGMTGWDQLGRAIDSVTSQKSLDGAVLRVRLVGQRYPGLDFEPSDVPAWWSERLAHLEIRDDSLVSDDLTGISREFTSRGELVRRLTSKANTTQTEQTVAQALRLALNAFQD
jgi:DNA repair exonuclease SbcCD nuclease subunit